MIQTGASPPCPRTPLATLPSLIQVAVGDTNTVWRRDTSNHVYRFGTMGSTFSRATLVGAATHMAAKASCQAGSGGVDHI